MKKTLLVFLALLAVMLVFTACGEETEATTKADATTVPAVTEVPNTTKASVTTKTPTTTKLPDTIKAPDTTKVPSEPEKPVGEGLEFAMNQDRKSYRVVSIGECTDKDLVIPSTYKGYPVTGISAQAFKN